MTSSFEKKVVAITGASGLLGRTLMKVFSAEGRWKKVVGTALTRTGQDLVRVDLSRPEEVERFIRSEKPDFLVHAAAQRFPDLVEKDTEAARRLNVEATGSLARCMAEHGGRVLYISTDYVFDGESPPYGHDSPAKPLNTYGQLKLEGERAVMDVSEDNVVLRIPVLYGQVEYLAESAVTTLLQLLLPPKEDGKAVAAPSSDYEIRRPSHVRDISQVAQDLLSKKAEGADVSGVFQWCGSEPFTKYGMVKAMSSAFDLDMSHVKAQPEKPPSGGPSRPYDTTMDRGRVEALGIHHHTEFKEGIKEALTCWVKK